MISTLDFPAPGTDFSEQLVAALRAELAEYGGLLMLFDEQQKAILHRDASRVAELSGDLEQQAGIASIRRKQRGTICRAFAVSVGSVEESSLGELIPFFPEPMRPMVEALIGEVNRLIRHTRRRAGQNQMLLSRAMEISGDLLARLSPETMTKTYSPRGRVKMNAAAQPARLLTHG